MKKENKMKRFMISIKNYSIIFRYCTYSKDTDMKPNWKRRFLGIEFSKYEL